MKKKVIVDTDAGVDDAFALAFALEHPDWEVIAVTTVCGNVGAQRATLNTGILLHELDKKQIPLYKGAQRPLLAPPDWEAAPWVGHGADGLGNKSHLYEQFVPYQEGENAANAIVRLCLSMPEEVYLVCLGPFTNIALAIHLSEEFARWLGSVPKGRFIAMGGCYWAQGNAGFSSEFNIHTDPEAASICFQFASSLTLVTWELTRDFPIAWTIYDSLMKKEIAIIEEGGSIVESDKGALVVGNTVASAIIRFLSSIGEHLDACCRESTKGHVMCDLLAMAVALCPEVILEAKDLHGCVELSGTHTRGHTAFDWLGRSPKNKNISLVMKVDQERYHNILSAVFGK